MDVSEDKQGQGSHKAGDQPGKEPRCDPKQLELLRKCSEKKHMGVWNSWRKKNPEEEIWLQGAKLSRVHLKGAKLFDAHLEGAILSLAHLKRANVSHAHLEGTQLVYAHLEGTRLPGAYLEGADLYGAYLKGAHLRDAHLEGADLWGAHIEGAIFQASVVDGSTLLWNCSLDRKTDFRGVGLDTCRISPISFATSKWDAVFWGFNHEGSKDKFICVERLSSSTTAEVHPHRRARPGHHR